MRGVVEDAAVERRLKQPLSSLGSRRLARMCWSPKASADHCQRRPLPAPAAPTAARVGPRELPGPEVRGPARLKRRLVVEVAALGLPLAAGATFAVAALT